MPNKLSRFCLGVMEAAWLAAVCAIPLFFDIYSSRIFEPDKITILRSLALLTLAAWVVKIINEGGIKWSKEVHDTSLFYYLWHYPLIAPVVGIMIVYILSTIFSVTPSISLFGSYQRLQGTYTTFSYLVIFISVLVNLRTRDQINRLVTTIIFSSLPISLYGLLQKYQIDPIPWGGNVSTRIASNMGNSIFVAAYLILVFPLTIGKIIESFREILSINEQSGVTVLGTPQKIIKATIYVFIAAMEIIAIYMSGSRGPLLGLMAGVYFLALLLSIVWRKRWLIFTIIGVAVLGGAFLVVFNINNGPLEALKKSPAIGRFGLLLDPESNSALVRQYIWEGTVKLVGFHPPLKFPDGSSDPFNFLRPILGYGPETMYVAYNQFYQPELGRVEKRNASPDRSHNETWDSIVITGLAGLLVYLSVFSTVFYYGLKWQGLIRSKRQKYLFFICLVGGGVLGAVLLSMLKGIEFLGVGLPFGMVLGMVAYLTLFGLFSSKLVESIKLSNPYMVLMIVVFSAVVGHFIEINFGIAIVSTRTLFWTYAGMILVLGYVLPKQLQSGPETANKEMNSDNGSLYTRGRKDRHIAYKQRRKNDRINRSLLGEQPAWMQNAMIGAGLIGIILATLGFDYVTNSNHSTSFLSIFINSLTRLPNKNNAFSLGILALLMITWIIGVLLYSIELNPHEEPSSWIKSLGFIGSVGMAIGLLFWVLHSFSLATLAGFTPSNQNDVITQVNSIGSLLTKYYLYIFLILVLVAFVLPEGGASRTRNSMQFAVYIIPVVLIVLFIFTNLSNLRVIQADITFKMAEPFANGDQWQVATFLYKRTLDLAPREDHYYLFLGRSYLEQAKITDATTDQDALVLQAEKDLKVAQSINPLNTDHTANLARLYSWWAGKATTTSDRAARAQKASDYYATAVTLSPNNSGLWDEWAILYMQVIGQSQQAFQRLQHALDLDSSYSYTQGLMGDYYKNIASSTSDGTTKKQALESAKEYYTNAEKIVKATDPITKVSYLLSLGNVYTMLANLDPGNIDHSQLQEAITVLSGAMKTGVAVTDQWRIQEALARLYVQLGDKSNALAYANQALNGAPSTSISRIQELITQTLSLP